MDHDKAAVIFSALSEASGKLTPVELSFDNMEEAESTQRFIAGLMAATGVRYITILVRDNFSLKITAER